MTRAELEAMAEAYAYQCIKAGEIPSEYRNSLRFAVLFGFLTGRDAAAELADKYTHDMATRIKKDIKALGEEQ